MAKKHATILVVDDHKSILSSIEFLLEFEFDRVITLNNPNRIPEIFRTENVDVVLLDMNFSAGINSGNEGIFWLKKIQELDKTVAVIMLTAYGEFDLAVNAIKEGALDFIVKPWDNKKLITTIHAGLKLRKSNTEVNKLNQTRDYLIADSGRDFADFLGQSDAINEVKRIITRISQTDANVLITGENGTGKELVAREIHRQSLRNSQAFITVDMAAISENLLESELFGHTKGAFTDAKIDKVGRFETASGGSLFLDEIGNLSIEAQAKILTALERREIVRLGDVRAREIDIRLISATNKNLDEMIVTGEFRQDLLYRINTIQIGLPALRDRKDDIPLLANHFLKVYCKKYNKHVKFISAEALAEMELHHWPGNVRELRHTIEKAVIFAEDSSIEPEHLALKITSTDTEKSFGTLSLEETEKLRILEALKNNNWHLNQTADELQIARQTLYRKIKKFGLVE